MHNITVYILLLDTSEDITTKFRDGEMNTSQKSTQMSQQERLRQKNFVPSRNRR